MKNPSKEQIEAITHFKGPALVIAGPGSGKTYTIIQRILYLTEQKKIEASNILVITFTRAAANEMQTRYLKSIHCKYQEVQFGTFHSICYHLLFEQTNFKDYHLISEVQKKDLIKNILFNHGFHNLINYDYLLQFINEISFLKNFSDHNKLYEESIWNMPEETRDSIIFEYNDYLETEHLFDYDDLILKCLELLRNNPILLSKYQSTYSFILADEFQDLNSPQYAILKLLSGENGNLFVVGDDDQAIYGFRGATPGIMKNFIQDHPDAITYYLTANYRSTQEIIRIASKVISESNERFEKQFISNRIGGIVGINEFSSRAEEEIELINILKKKSANELENTAVILRTNIEVYQYRELLRNHQLQVAQSGKVVKATLCPFIYEEVGAFFSYIYSGSKRSDFIQFMNKPTRYLSRMALPNEIVTRETVLLFYQNNSDMTKQVNVMFDYLELARTLSPYLALKLFINNLNYIHYIKQKSTDKKQQELYLQTLEKISEKIKKEYNTHNLKQILEESLQTDKVNNSINSEKGIHVITMHAAKGLEFDDVILLDVNEGMIPSKRSSSPEEIEEERRLLYVAITRAKKEITIFYTKERNRKPSRFIRNLIQETHQTRHYPDTHQMHLQQFQIPHHHQ